jgi:hypothetical protein
MSKELCGYCADTIEDCKDAGECNYGIEGYEDDTCVFCNGACRCDYNYDKMREDALEYERLDEKRNEDEQDYGDDD